MPTIFVIALGGAIGSVLRHLTGVVIARANPTDFPLHTLLINVVGSFLIGLLMVLLAEKFALSPEWRAFLVVGVLGGFTTFSAFSLETMLMIEQGQFTLAGFYIVISVAGAVTAALLGAGIGGLL